MQCQCGMLYDDDKSVTCLCTKRVSKIKLLWCIRLGHAGSLPHYPSQVL